MSEGKCFLRFNSLSRNDVKYKNALALFAFTLAEVLITLGIIGVVASMTIPILINNSNNNANASMLREMYSVISNATTQIVTDNSGGLWDNSSSDSQTLSLNMKNAYKQLLSWIKDDTANNIITVGWYGYKSNTIIMTAYLNTNRYVLTLKNGCNVYFYSGQNCPDTIAGSTSVICGNILIDVTGNKGPNMFGKDVFVVEILKNINGNYITVPAGTATARTCDPATSGSTVISNYGCTES